MRMKKACEHCGFINHSRRVLCLQCGKEIEHKGVESLPRSITPKFIKNFHLEVDEIRRGLKK